MDNKLNNIGSGGIKPISNQPTSNKSHEIKVAKVVVGIVFMPFTLIAGFYLLLKSGYQWLKSDKTNLNRNQNLDQSPELDKLWQHAQARAKESINNDDFWIVTDLDIKKDAKISDDNKWLEGNENKIALSKEDTEYLNEVDQLLETNNQDRLFELIEDMIEETSLDFSLAVLSKVKTKLGSHEKLYPLYKKLKQEYLEKKLATNIKVRSNPKRYFNCYRQSIDVRHTDAQRVFNKTLKHLTKHDNSKKKIEDYQGFAWMQPIFSF